jgi:hypothetical protein
MQQSVEQISDQIFPGDLQVLGNFIQYFGQRADPQLFVGRDCDVMFGALRHGIQMHMTAGLSRYFVSVLAK